MQSYNVQTVVAGAGVIGLAIARYLAMRGEEVLVVEAESAIGTATSSRNSEVIHAGIYYPAGSLKARLCVEGRRLLAEYCTARAIPHAWVGKCIVATKDTEIPALEQILRRAATNDVPELIPLSGAALAQKTAGLVCVAALWSPVTGIVDSHGLMLSFLADAEDAGAVLALRSPIIRGEVVGDGFLLETGGADPTRLRCRTLINAAGLGAVDLARHIAGIKAEYIPDQYFCRGHYFTLSGRHPFRHLVYPVPEQAGLGIHLTLDLGGQARFGPDTEWIETLDYGVDVALAAKFTDAIRRYWPGLPENALNPGYSGIRPKISPPGAPAADFRIDGPSFHQIPGLVNLFGIESPGLTSSMAIAELVGHLLPG